MLRQPRNSEEIPIGEQLGYLEYQVTQKLISDFQIAVDYSEAAFPNLAAREYLEVLAQKYRVSGADSITHSDHYYRPPVAGRRVQVTGWVRDLYQRRGAERLLVETFAVDDIGTEILRSQHTLQLGTARVSGRLGRNPASRRRAPAGELLPAVRKRVTEEAIERFEAARRALLGQAADMPGAHLANIHTSAGLATGMGLSGAVAPGELGLAYLQELLDRRFGVDFRQGGTLTVNYRRPFYAGDVLVAQGLVTAREAAGSRVTWQVQVWLENDRGEQVITGDARVTTPSPLT